LFLSNSGSCICLYTYIVCLMLVYVCIAIPKICSKDYYYYYISRCKSENHKRGCHC
jgi:hypothetical protein